jgi:Icc-related predicted phosphoesterase
MLEPGERNEVRMARKRFIPGKMKLLFSSDLHGLDSAYYAFAAALKDGDYDLGVLGGDLMTYPSRSEIEQTGIELQKTGEICQIQDGRPPR